MVCLKYNVGLIIHKIFFITIKKIKVKRSMFKISNSLSFPKDFFTHKDRYLYYCCKNNWNQKRRQNSAECQKYHHKGREFKVILPVVNDKHCCDEMRSIDSYTQFGN